MEIKSTKRKGLHRLAVSGEATVYGVSEAADALRSALAGADRLQVDLSSVSEIDSAFIQLLLAAGRQADRDEKKMEIVGYGGFGEEAMLVLSALHVEPSAGC